MTHSPFDLSRIQTWIFDLDNTLYPPSSGLVDKIMKRTAVYMAQRLGMTEQAAMVLAVQYYGEYGTTMNGLRIVHGVDPVEFFENTHMRDYHAILPQPTLGDDLRRLSGRRVIYTNAARCHAVGVLERVGVADCFEDIFDIMDGDYIAKPDMRSFQRMMTKCAVDPATACMVDDSIENLKTAESLGMTTVLVSHKSHKSHKTQDSEAHMGKAIHYITDDLPQWLNTLDLDVLPAP